MAIRRAVLTLAALAVAAVAPAVARGVARAFRAPASAPPGCVACHEARRYATHFASLGTCIGCHRGDARARRRDVAHDRLLRGPAAAWSIPGVGAVRDGERWRDALGCRRCHVTGGAGNPLAISLDEIAWQREQGELRDAIRRPATYMPDFGLSDAQADRLIAVLLRDGDRHGRLGRYQVHFRGDAPRAGAFVTRCGPCHRALTAAGPLGVGSSGPNLSGLLTRFYPPSEGRRWDRARLERWIRNPRAERPRSTMAPVELRPDELQEIVRLLGKGDPLALAPAVAAGRAAPPVLAMGVSTARSAPPSRFK